MMMFKEDKKYDDWLVQFREINPSIPDQEELTREIVNGALSALQKKRRRTLTLFGSTVSLIATSVLFCVYINIGRLSHYSLVCNQEKALSLDTKGSIQKGNDDLKYRIIRSKTNSEKLSFISMFLKEKNKQDMLQRKSID